MTARLIVLLIALVSGGVLATPVAAEPISTAVVAPGSDLTLRLEFQRGGGQRPFRQWRLPERRGPSQEPAAARGYADGYKRGVDDGRDRDRYDPVRHGDYREGDEGYYREYGSKDAYKNNYRAGFRQGYEDGYREGNRRR
jgi:hypothetical protein